MRTTIDGVIESSQLGVQLSVENPTTFYGGKALMRLVSAMDRRGFYELAESMIANLVPAEVQGTIQAAREQFSAAPPTLSAAPPERMEARDAERDVQPRRARARARRRADDVETEGDGYPVAASAVVGQMYHEAALARSRPARILERRDATSAPADALGLPESIPTQTGPQWRSIGPWTIPNGQTYGSSRVNVSGRVVAIAVHPSNPARVLCGSASGGIWESFDRGASWAPRTDYAATLSVGALVYDPSNPNTVYCGTGEGNTLSMLGAGILRSTDGGTAWSTLCTTPFVGQSFFDLQVSPSDGNLLIGATSFDQEARTGGLSVSTDGGTSWTQRLAVATWSIAVAPRTAASAEILAGCSDGVYRSTNGGTGWARETLPGAPAGFVRLAVAIASSNPSIAYAWGAGQPFVVDARFDPPREVPTAYLWRRAGGSWTQIARGAAGVGNPPGNSTVQAWYDWYVAAPPDRDDQVFVGEIESYRADLSGTTWVWTKLSNKGASGDSIHPDQHAIAFEPGNPNTIYIGCDGGLFRSNNRGIDWVSCNNGLVISEIEYLAQDYGSSRFLLAGTQDNGTQLWTGAPTWTHVADGDGGDCGVNRTNPRIVFHTFYGMSPERSTTGGGFGSWTDLRPYLPIPSKEGSAFYPPFECSANGGDTIGIGGDAVYVSRNNGANWTRLAYPDVPARSSAMSIPNPDTMYVGTADGRIYRAAWSGTAWSALSALAQPRPSARVSSIRVDPSNGQRMWATYSTKDTPTSHGRVFRSDDGGGHWQDRTAGLSNLPVHAIEIDNLNSNRVWIAADLGVFQSLDAGATWADFSATLPNCLIGDLLFHPHARVLRAGTRSRGVWEIPVDGWMEAPVCGVQFSGTLGANETKRWFTFNWPATWHVIWTVMPTTPNAGGAQITWTVSVERASAEYATYWISVQNLTNIQIAFEARYAVLSRY